MKRIATMVMVIALVGIQTSDAAIYRWVDDQGRAHYTETPPPPGNKDRGTVINTTGPASGAQQQAEQRSNAMQERLKTFRDNREKQEKEAADQAAEVKRQATNCSAARSNLSKLENRRMRRLTDPEGNVTMLTEEERGKKIAAARKQIRENCK